MSGTVEWPQVIALLGVVVTITSLIALFASSRRTVRKDAADEAQGIQEMRGDLKYVVRGMDEVKDTLRRQGDEMRGLDGRITRAEESANLAHKRLDGLERRRDELKGE